MPLAMLDFATGAIRCNRAYAELLGIAPDDLARDGLKAIEATADRVLLQSDTTPRFWEIPPGVERRDIVPFRDGRIFERCVTPCDVGDRVVGHVVTYRDVTASIQAERALEQNRALLEQAQRVAHVGSWVADLTRGQIEWTDESRRIFGLAPEEVPQTPEDFYPLVHQDDRPAVREALARVIERDDAYDLEHRIQKPTGEIRWVHGRADVERDPTGRPIRLIGTVQDITDRRRLEEQLRQAQKLEAIGRLAGGVAHDLNNALTSIVGYTELALGALSPDHPATADVSEIRRAAERAESVTRQLLAFSRRQPLRPRVFSLGDTAVGLTRMLTRFLGDRIQLEISVAPDVAPILGDPGQLEQAIVNLAVNAKDAMPDGGVFRLAVAMVRLEDRFESQHDAMPPGDYVELAVSDNGIGIPPATMAHLFEPFFTTKEPGQGTGLGLAMVYGSVKQIGGFVSVESAVDAGATFRLRFPPAPPVTPETPQIHQDGLSRATEPTILVVEDEQPVRNLVLQSLANRGYRVVAASSATQALKMLASESLDIDLLLTDANMPGMSGIELVRTLLAERPALPVIVMSGFTEDLPRLGEAENRVSLLSKPFTPRQIRERVDRIFGRG